MQKIHPQSDIKFRIYFRDPEGITPLPRFEFRYFTTDKRNFIVASYDGVKYTNCEPCTGGVTASWDCPHFDPAPLRVLRQFSQADTAFDDHSFDLVRAELTNIEISDLFENINFSSEIVEEIGYYRDEKGEKGEKGDKGDKGDQGPQGIQGVQGAQGLKGDKGDQGIQGVKGDTGATGLDGASAYAGAKASGYPNSESLFYQDLSTVVNKSYVSTAISNSPGYASTIEKDNWNSKTSVSDINTLNLRPKNLTPLHSLVMWNNAMKYGQSTNGDYIDVVPTDIYTGIARSGQQYDIFGSTVPYRPLTQYAFSIRWQQLTSVASNNINIRFIYTDGSVEILTAPASSTAIVTQSFVTASGKSLSKISSASTSTAVVRVYNVQLTEGSTIWDFTTSGRMGAFYYQVWDERPVIGQTWLSRDGTTFKQLYTTTFCGTCPSITGSYINLSSVVDSIYSTNGMVYSGTVMRSTDGGCYLSVSSNTLRLAILDSAIAGWKFSLEVKYTKA